MIGQVIDDEIEPSIALLVIKPRECAATNGDSLFTLAEHLFLSSLVLFNLIDLAVSNNNSHIRAYI